MLPVSMFKVRGESTKALSHFSNHFSVVYIPIFFHLYLKRHAFKSPLTTLKGKSNSSQKNHGCEYLGSFRMGDMGGTYQ